MAILWYAGQHRSACTSTTLRAVGAVTVYTLTPKDFESLLDDHPQLVFKVMRALFRVTHANLSRMNQESKQLSNYIHKSQGRY